VFLSAFEPFKADWAPVIAVIAALTMILGHRGGGGADQSQAHAGVFEHRARRLSAGGLVAANDVGKAAILFYLLAYSVTNLAAFGAIALLGARDRANDELRDYAGLWHSHPALAGLVTVSLLSLGGLPPTAGFIASGTSSAPR
jgi:NADH-quinone oxidoreductase subunit N